MSKFRKTGTLLLTAVMALSAFSTVGTTKVQAADFSGQLKSADSVTINGNVATVSFNGGAITGKITFLEDGIFRYNVDPAAEFSDYPTVRGGYPDTGKIVAQSDNSDRYTKPAATDASTDDAIVIKSGSTTIEFDKDTALMTVKSGDSTVMEEKVPLTFNGSNTVQTLVQHTEKSNTSETVAEQFYGGGTQNGRLVHTGEVINIANESSWTDGGVSSPSPFYYTTNGYGVLRNTWRDGSYDFGSTEGGTVTTQHNENEYDAYIFVSDADNGSSVAQELLTEYFKVTGNPVLLPEYGFYLGHLNAYNRDAWSSDTDIGSNWTIKGNDPYTSTGKTTYEAGGTGYEITANSHGESLNGEGPTVSTGQIPQGVDYPYEFSAQAVLNEYQEYDIPLGFFLPNDGYGAGYGKNGYKMTGGVDSNGNSSEERLAAVAANVENLRVFATYAANHGVATGLWTQSNLEPDSNPNTYWHTLRDFDAEVAAGVTTLKTDVYWVGNGYSFQLSGVKGAYNTITDELNARPNIISLDGWAGSQRYNSVWTGDQTGGNWEYIRFHIPTFIGQSLSGNPNIGSDMDGIWGGSPIIATRDYQWKSFAPQMLDMDGWGSYAKGPYVHGDPFTGVSRMYLKLKAQMMPYIYTNAYAAANIDTGNGDTGLPMIRAMFLEYPDEAYAYTEAGSQYQYMWGEYLLVAPVYQDTDADDMGNDVRNGIYLPGGEDQIWIDYFTGEQYRGGQVLNDFDAPLWKLPLFVKNGAIIPMYAEHNSALASTDESAKSVDKSIRLIEFWPNEESEFTAIEDDGNSISNEITQEDGYGDVESIDYGEHVTTKYTSSVVNGTATLTAEQSTGSYNGYESTKDTTFIVNVSQKPTNVTATNGSSNLTIDEVTSKADFDAKAAEEGHAVYFYDESPKIETYASEEEENLAKMVADETVSPKLYVKFAKTDTQANAQKLVIEGFVNDGKLNSTNLNENLGVPTLNENEDAKTPSSIMLQWNNVTDATEYEILVDGTIDETGNVTSGMIHSAKKAEGETSTFTHTDLNYHSEHSYYIRSVNADGHSRWSAVLTTRSAEDPFRLTPDVTADQITWEGAIYGNHNPILAFDETFQTGDGGFHSDGNSIGQALTIDYGKAYIFDRIEYYPRDDAGNGTVTKMRVETSLDGVNWVQHGDSESSVDPDASLSYNWAGDKTMKTIELRDPNTNTDSIGARYIRLTPLASVGNFFSASEIKPYTIDGAAGSADRPFLVGNISTVGMSEPSITTFQQMYQKGSSQHGSSKNPNWVGEVQKVYGDINFNGIADVWDYAFTAFNVDGGTTKTGSVSGDILLQPSATSLQSGETLTIDVTAIDVKNLNAYGSIINYNPELLEYAGTEYVGTGSMYTQGMTGNAVYDDGTAYINHNAVNMGDQPLVNGSKVLATITLRAKDNIDVINSDVIDLSSATLIGPDYSIKESKVVTDVEIPDIPTTTTKEYGQNDFTITMTNDVLKTDDGSNVSAIVQTGSYSGLFDGNYGRDFEFKWDTGQTVLPEGQKLPTTMHLAMNNPAPMSTIEVHNANKGNGYLTSMSAEVFYTDDSSDTFTFDAEQTVYTMNVDDSKTVRQVDLTFLTSTGTANENNNPRDNRMLTLAEIDFKYTSGTPAEEIKPVEGYATEMYAGYVESIDAIVYPETCPNQYFTVTSSDPSVASIITLVDEDGNPQYKVLGISEGTTKITLTAAADENVTFTYDLTVKEGVNKEDLVAAISQTTGVPESIYTADSYAAYKSAYDHAVQVNDDAEATRAEVEAATAALLEAYDALVIQPVDSSLELDPDQVIADANALYSESNTADKMFDDDLSTYWESPYGGENAKLPQEIILTLDHTYMLEQISFTSHTIQNGGVTGYKISVSMDGQQWTDVTSGTVDPNAYKKGENVRVDARFVPAQAKYVKFTVTGAVGRVPAEDNMYGRIAEMDLYGTKAVEKGELYDLAQQAQDIKNDGYTEDSWNALQEAINAAFDVYDDKDATAEEIQTAYENLQTAIEGLKKEEPVDPEPTPDQVNKDALWALLEKYDGYVSTDYTADSWAAFYSAYETASAVAQNDDATQDEVDAAVAALERAGAALVPASGSEKPDGSPDNEYNQTEKPADTSASMPIAPYACVTLLAAGAAFVAIRKKRTAK